MTDLEHWRRTDFRWSRSQDWNLHYTKTTFRYSEIRISIQQQDLYTLCKSFLYIEGKLTVKKRNDKSQTMHGNNCVALMFDEIRYELNGVETDCNRNVGITSIIKNYVSLT